MPSYYRSAASKMPSKKKKNKNRLVAGTASMSKKERRRTSRGASTVGYSSVLFTTTARPNILGLLDIIIPEDTLEYIAHF